MSQKGSDLSGYKMICPFKQHIPQVDPTVFVADSAQLIGDLTIGRDSSVWFGCVLRADVHFIRIGTRTNVQDLSVLHVTGSTHPLVIGDNVTIGHRALLHGCTVKDRVLIGMGAILLDGSVVEEGCIIGAGALVTEGAHIPAGSLALGVPARVKRILTEEEKVFLTQSAENYVELSRIYLQSP